MKDLFGGGGEESESGGGGAASGIDVSRDDIPSGPGWSYSEGVFTIANNANVILTGNTSDNCVAVAESATATVTLSKVTINMKGGSDAPAFDVKSGADVTLVLAMGTKSYLWSDGSAAGLQVPSGSFLTITGSVSGKLYAEGEQKPDEAGAGIGGESQQSAGEITISGGTIEAQGGYYSSTFWRMEGGDRHRRQILWKRRHYLHFGQLRNSN